MRGTPPGVGQTRKGAVGETWRTCSVGGSRGAVSSALQQHRAEKDDLGAATQPSTECWCSACWAKWDENASSLWGSVGQQLTFEWGEPPPPDPAFDGVCPLRIEDLRLNLGTPSGHTAFIVRTWGAASASSAARLARWAMELEKYPDIDFWVSIDESRGPFLHSLPAQALVHRFTEHEMARTFGTLQEIHNIAYLYGRSLGWCFHVESVLLWWARRRCNYDHVWIVEHDVGFSGNISRLVMAHARDFATDLIAPKAGGTPRPLVDSVNPPSTWDSPALPPTSWYFYHVASERYLTFLESRGLERLYCPEQVSRCSRRLLLVLKRCVESGLCAQSEQCVVTLCEAFGLSRRGLGDALVGDRFLHNTTLSEEEFAQRCHDDALSGSEGRLYHALKF